MVTFRNNNRRHRFRSNDRFKKNNDLNKIKFKSESNASGFQRKIQIGRNGQNLPKLIEKYNNLAREAIANEDKILSENYYQHAEHFIRILDEKKKNNSLSENNNQKENGGEKNKEKEVKEESACENLDKKIASI